MPSQSSTATHGDRTRDLGIREGKDSEFDTAFGAHVDFVLRLAEHLVEAQREEADRRVVPLVGAHWEGAALDPGWAHLEHGLAEEGEADRHAVEVRCKPLAHRE